MVKRGFPEQVFSSTEQGEEAYPPTSKVGSILYTPIPEDNARWITAWLLMAGLFTITIVALIVGGRR